MSLLTRWEPFGSVQDEMSRFRRDFDRMFGRQGIAPTVLPGMAAPFPAVNLWEDENQIIAEAELPGLKLADLEITITGENRLTIKGRRDQTTVQNAEWHREERAFGPFERVLEVPFELDSGRVEARLEQGVLTIKMAKSPKAKPRRIIVKSE